MPSFEEHSLKPHRETPEFCLACPTSGLYILLLLFLTVLYYS